MSATVFVVVRYDDLGGANIRGVFSSDAAASRYLLRHGGGEIEEWLLDEGVDA